MSDPATPSTDALIPPPLPYHRLLHALPSYRWWKPLVALVITAVLWIIFTAVVVVIGVVIAVAQGRISFDTVPGARSSFSPCSASWMPAIRSRCPSG